MHSFFMSEEQKVPELLILISLVCIVYLFTKKGKKPKRRLNEWEQGAAVRRPNSVHSFEPKVVEKNPKIVEVALPKTGNKTNSVPHKKSTYLATKTERRFYRVLQELIPDEYVIHSQVSLMALVQPTNFKDNSRTWAKRMDYVITDRDTKVLAVIELDDSSHRQKKRQERDIYVNNALNGHHPLLRFEARSSYDKTHIATVLERDTIIKCRELENALQYS
ncbi:DUF2726 domain-containing protein [Vibrio parahaemolyticus]|uniref:DUF2726 domain-containing protein n=1 Tax=Vibrio parahaemolyticus TaxID=670 RepID=UPI00111DB6DE|nr:DUF2726 domain-containing protein [Vibrio parahaemolyticus]EHH1238174.1 DUF2726 domain-containing protein [Vibrio parahaemolyticus]MBE3872487.1 DUF2726 domain-containing protein [Vibrio parahaemolyticus]MBE3946255.1 DUF2726 domain-containing protein [Vibrio parahaemolyticus]MDG2800576.1 DUF2726 domain-containing protein [Vibrio parahaemolyticus]MDG3024809.1 DUF2726 domain-containing protein [Vibrio parahaemolyticus]